MPDFDELQKKKLSPTYYLNNFTKLLKFVEENYDDLLTKKEKSIIESFKLIPKNARLLFVRLISRKGPFFLIEKLNYEEISLTKAIDILLKHKFIKKYDKTLLIEKDYYLEDYLRVFSRKELESILSAAGHSGLSKLKKPDLIECFYQDDEIREKLISSFPLLTLEHTDEFQLFFYLFFGNFHQTLSDFILEDVGALKYERYRIDKETRLFDSRKSITQSKKFHEAREACYICMELGEFDEAFELWKTMAKNKGKHYSLNRKFRDYSDQLGRHFERLGDYDQALDCYSKSKSSFAKERSIRVFVELSELEKASRHLKKIATYPQNFDELDFVRKFGKKLTKLTGVDYPLDIPWSFPEEKWVIKKLSQTNVEEMVVKELKKKRHKALHSENWFWNSLLGLAFWDIIFKPLPGVFHHPFQRGPVDLFHPEDFYENRKELIEKRLKSIKNGRYCKQILNTAKKKYKTANYLVSWNYLDLGFLERVLETFPADKLEAILRRQLRELRRNSSGLPDVFSIDPKGRPFLYEVKGPGDQLRPNQRAWLSFMNDIGIDCSVLWVSYK